MADDPTPPAAKPTPEPDKKNQIEPPATPPKDPEVVDRAMRKMAERAPDEYLEISAMMGGMMGHPLHQKMNEQHITKMLDLAVQHDTNEYDLRKNQQAIDSKNHGSERLFHLIYFAIFVALVVFVILAFQTQPTVLAPILTGIGGAVTGFIGGTGYAKMGSKKK